MQPDSLRITLVAVSLVAALLGAAIAILLIARARSARQRAERENKDLLDRLQRLAGSLSSAQDSERARVARDLHDDLSQQLAALSIALSGLKRRMGAGTPGVELQADVASIQQRVIALGESVRDLSHDLHPDVLKHAGLARALSARCDELSRSHAIAASCSAVGEFESVDADTRHCLYRVAQEALHNVVKHAGAQRVEVRLVRTGDAVEVTIADDGRGFDVAEARRTRDGLGLLSINERVRLAGGTLSVVTEPGKGTRIRVQLPCAAGVHA